MTEILHANQGTPNLSHTPQRMAQGADPASVALVKPIGQGTCQPTTPALAAVVSGQREYLALKRGQGRTHIWEASATGSQGPDNWGAQRKQITQEQRGRQTTCVSQLPKG